MKPVKPPHEVATRFDPIHHGVESIQKTQPPRCWATKNLDAHAYWNILIFQNLVK